MDKNDFFNQTVEDTNRLLEGKMYKDLDNILGEYVRKLTADDIMSVVFLLKSTGDTKSEYTNRKRVAIRLVDFVESNPTNHMLRGFAWETAYPEE